MIRIQVYNLDGNILSCLSQGGTVNLTQTCCCYSLWWDLAEYLLKRLPKFIFNNGKRHLHNQWTDLTLKVLGQNFEFYR